MIITCHTSVSVAVQPIQNIFAILGNIYSHAHLLPLYLVDLYINRNRDRQRIDFQRLAGKSCHPVFIYRDHLPLTCIIFRKHKSAF